MFFIWKMILGPLLLFWNPAQALVRRWPFVYCILQRTMYSLIQYLDLQGEKWNREKNSISGFSTKKRSMAEERVQRLQTWPSRARWLKCHYLKDSRHLHYFAWASIGKWRRAGRKKHCFFSFLKNILSGFLASHALGWGWWSEEVLLRRKGHWFPKG